jgi:hypothetical protein
MKLHDDIMIGTVTEGDGPGARLSRLGVRRPARGQVLGRGLARAGLMRSGLTRLGLTRLGLTVYRYRYTRQPERDDALK